MGQFVDWALLTSTIQMMTPLLLAALGGAICARTGIFNVALEGQMLTGAFFAVVATHFTNNPWLGVLAAVVASTLFSAILGYLVTLFQANEIVVGIALNFLATALTTYLLRSIFNVTGAFYDKNMPGLTALVIPGTSHVPWLSWLSGYTVLVYLAVVLVFVLRWFFQRTVAGFHFDATGYQPEATASLGLNVQQIRFIAILLSGVLCGLAGAQMSIGELTMFSEGMTAGRGFIALVAMMLGQSSPLGIWGASALFGLTEALGNRFQDVLPTEFAQMIPYVITILAMFLFKDREYLRLSEDTSA